MPNELILDEDTPNDILFDPQYSRGTVPRDFSVDPPEMFAPPSEMVLIPRSEWSARIKEMADTKTRLSDLLKGKGIGPLDQGSEGFCWTYSVGMAQMASRARSNQPTVRLSPHAVGCKIKEFRNEGGWCGLSAKFASETGYPDESFWPQQSMSRSHDNPATWANAAKHKTTVEWRDLTRPVWDSEMVFDAVMTCLFNRTGAAGDYPWWAHSVFLCDPVEIERDSFGIRIFNSWGPSWSDGGYGILRGSKAVPGAAVAIVSSTLSV